MTMQAAPEFALSFSSDAVHLLERIAPAGSSAPWRERGRAFFDAADFRAQITRLREAARRPDGSAATVALVIPDDQILYTSLPIAGEVRRPADLGPASGVPVDDVLAARTGRLVLRGRG